MLPAKNEPFFRRKQKKKDRHRQQTLNEFLFEYPDLQSRKLLAAELGFMNKQEQKRLSKE